MLIQGLTNLIEGASNAVSSLAESAYSIVSPQHRTDDQVRETLVALHGVPYGHALNTNLGIMN